MTASATLMIGLLLPALLQTSTTEAHGEEGGGIITQVCRGGESTFHLRGAAPTIQVRGRGRGRGSTTRAGTTMARFGWPWSRLPRQQLLGMS